ncbi:hypothetical protein K491DRAFT_693873 [Lophiostoma macrostomum CBS 122681]|uniref:Uncharacterized protein n=1 Tax=Lophiostoma macrostomum CBS 122681 TaxID=1314788 RepID=A0A6A6T3V5_9PLEO|nr:hypothetical protein K491DRAFT_693873 [Lophiostoma macrostomum CBS 122681]
MKYFVLVRNSTNFYKQEIIAARCTTNEKRATHIPRTCRLLKSMNPITTPKPSQTPQPAVTYEIP